MQEHILTTQLNDAGLFAMSIYVRGYPFVIIVDDYIPYIWGQAVFTKVSSRGDVWAMLAEKAWIKLSGTAENAEGGMCTEIIDFMFSCPTNVFWISGDLEGDPERAADLVEFCY